MINNFGAPTGYDQTSPFQDQAPLKTPGIPGRPPSPQPQAHPPQSALQNAIQPAPSNYPVDPGMAGWVARMPGPTSPLGGALAGASGSLLGPMGLAGAGIGAPQANIANLDPSQIDPATVAASHPGIADILANHPNTPQGMMAAAQAIKAQHPNATVDGNGVLGGLNGSNAPAASGSLALVGASLGAGPTGSLTPPVVPPQASSAAPKQASTVPPVGAPTPGPTTPTPAAPQAPTGSTNLADITKYLQGVYQSLGETPTGPGTGPTDIAYMAQKLADTGGLTADNLNYWPGRIKDEIQKAKSGGGSGPAAGAAKPGMSGTNPLQSAIGGNNSLMWQQILQNYMTQLNSQQQQATQPATVGN